MSLTECGHCHAPGLPVALKYHGDDILFWMCSKCENRWHHWPEGTGMHEVAAPYVQRGKDRL